jgi:hypothetical protein
MMPRVWRPIRCFFLDILFLSVIIARFHVPGPLFREHISISMVPAVFTRPIAFVRDWRDPRFGLWRLSPNCISVPRRVTRVSYYNMSDSCHSMLESGFPTFNGSVFVNVLSDVYIAPGSRIMQTASFLYLPSVFTGRGSRIFARATRAAQFGAAR